MGSPEEELKALETASLLRRLREVEDVGDGGISVGGQQLLAFSSNDYLGLSSHPRVKAAFCRGVNEWGAGAGASRLIAGSLSPYHALEDFIAAKKGKSAARLFANGYAASLGTLAGLMNKQDVILMDKLCHASLIDGAKMSGATMRVFPHNDVGKLERLLEKYRDHDGRVMIVTESVFSMDGDRAPLAAIVELKQRFGAWLMVDEAHALGVCGSMGLAHELGLEAAIDLHMGTLGKAAGVAGGYVACSQELADLLVNKARSFIYSTAPPPGQAVAALEALTLLHEDEGRELRERLWENIRYFAGCCGLEQQPASAIVPWHVGESDAALQLSERMLQHGLFVPAVRYPTVPRGTARLRVTLSARHSTEQIDQLVHALGS